MQMVFLWAQPYVAMYAYLTGLTGLLISWIILKRLNPANSSSVWNTVGEKISLPCRISFPFLATNLPKPLLYFHNPKKLLNRIQDTVSTLPGSSCSSTLHASTSLVSASTDTGHSVSSLPSQLDKMDRGCYNCGDPSHQVNT